MTTAATAPAPCRTITPMASAMTPATASTAAVPITTRTWVSVLAGYNALRYNVADGWVQVTTGTRNGRAVLLVADTGPQVPADQIQRLLQPFQRLGQDRVGEPGGSGLGLSIVAAIASAHGAVISARPGPDGGLSIEVSFAALAAGIGAPAILPGTGQLLRHALRLLAWTPRPKSSTSSGTRRSR